MTKHTSTSADLQPKDVPDETDDPGYPDTIENTGGVRDDEPTLDEPLREETLQGYDEEK